MLLRELAGSHGKHHHAEDIGFSNSYSERSINDRGRSLSFINVEIVTDAGKNSRGAPKAKHNERDAGIDVIRGAGRATTLFITAGPPFFC
ncbi:hypothetical protein MTO96_003645 [Rhipicephalus appendiculatus]